MDPKLLADISLPNLQEMRSKARAEDGSLLLPKVCYTKPLFNSRALFSHIYRAQGNNLALVQWAHQSKGEDRTMGS